ncbi:MAG: hypothetical protein A3H79_02800 [Candidatus Levybacteria bacterium RIFCSPLOWO2_02_FULL_36_8b]|nr:MAG: hypothetical protein A3H79_02800 [Candidatus Levybacteria bacterium RIFCSPLOWO2_02_FULL_36_8b]
MKKKDILIILFLLFIFVFAWIISNIYHNATSSTISETINKNISPIDPTFDINAINNLKKRQKINPSFELESPKTTPQIASQGGELTL